MKVLFSTIAMFLTLFAFGAEGASAQCDQATKEKLYKEFLDNRRATTVEGLQTAVNSGKRYVELCKNNPGDEEIVAFITRLLPRLEKALATEIRFTKFEQAAKNLNHAEAYKLGREILAEEPADSELRGDFSIYLTWAGYKAMDSVDASTTLGAIALGRETIALINNGAKIVDWGLFDGNFKQDKDGDSKSHTLGWLNFAIAEMLIKVDNKPEAMAHYYETTRFAAPLSMQTNSRFQSATHTAAT